jgi:hypothetical protein
VEGLRTFVRNNRPNHGMRIILGTVDPPKRVLQGSSGRAAGW